MNFFYKLSLRARLTIVFVLFFGGTLCVYSYYVYRTVNSVFESEFDILLLDFASDVSDSLDFSLFGGIRVDASQFRDKKLFPFSLKEAVIQVRDLRGRTLQKSRALGDMEIPLAPNELFIIYQKSFFFRNWSAPNPIANNKSFRIVNYRISSLKTPPLILQVAIPDKFVRDNSIQILNIFVISIPIVLLISAILGYSYSFFGLSPVRKLVDRLKPISARQLNQRLSMPLAKDELYDLSDSVNHLLERLDRAFQSQETFVSDASHQLKTPLAILKAELEMIASDKELLARQERVESMREEVDTLIATVNNLLLLARVDAGEDRLHLTEVSLGETVISAIQRLSQLANAKGIKIRLHFGGQLDALSGAELHVLGDADLLINLFHSLLENAIKYSPENSEIEVLVRDQGIFATIDIRDQGPGIPEIEKSRVFERFHRISRPGISGSGLGLSIAKRIADLHGASLDLHNLQNAGLEAHIEIKKF